MLRKWTLTQVQKWKLNRVPECFKFYNGILSYYTLSSLMCHEHDKNWRTKKKKKYEIFGYYVYHNCVFRLKNAFSLATYSPLNIAQIFFSPFRININV